MKKWFKNFTAVSGAIFIMASNGSLPAHSESYGINSDNQNIIVFGTDTDGNKSDNNFRENFSGSAYDLVMLANEAKLKIAEKNGVILKREDLLDPAIEYEIPSEEVKKISKEYLDWWYDSNINGIYKKDGTYTDSFAKLVNSIFGNKLFEKINAMIDIGYTVPKAISKLMCDKYSSDNACDSWKVEAFFINSIGRLLENSMCNRYSEGELETCFVRNEDGKWELFQPMTSNRRIKLHSMFGEKIGFERDCVLLYYIIMMSEKALYYLVDFTFDDGTNDFYMWINRGIEDFQTTK